MNPTTPPSMTKPRSPAPGCHPAQLEPCNILQWGQTDWKRVGDIVYIYMCVCLYCFYLYIVSICFYLCAPPHRASRSPWISFSRFSLRSCQASWSWKHWYVGEQGSCWKTHPYNGELEIPFHCHLCGQSSATITIFDHPNPGDIQSHRNQHWLKSAPAILVGLRFGHALILQLRHVLLHYGRWQLFHHVAISKSACGPYAGFSSMG